MFTFLAAKWLRMKCMQCASMLIVWPCSHVQSHAYSFYIYICVSLYVCLWSKNIYTKGNWIRSLFFCCCCKSASIKLCQSWKMPAGEVRKNPKHDQIYLGSWFFLLICLKTNLGMDAAHGFWKSKQWACYIILYFFFLGFNHALPSALTACKRWNVFNGHRGPCFATSVACYLSFHNLTWPDICHYDTRDDGQMPNSATKLVPRSHLNCMLNPKVKN